MLMESRGTDIFGVIVAFAGLTALFVGVVFIDRGVFRQALFAGAIVLSIAALAILLVPRLRGRG